MKKRPPRTVITGFTLVELIAAIAIMALLAALLVPVAKSFRQSGFQAKSVSNLKQLATGAAAYLADNDGFYPGFVALNPDGTPNYNKGWRYDSNFTKYVGIASPLEAPRNCVLFSGFPVQVANSIGFNNTEMGPASWAPPGAEVRTKKALRASTIPNPARLIMFAEATSQWMSETTRTQWTPAVDEGVGGGQFIAYRASGNTKTIAVTYGGNILMFDKAESADPELWHAYKK